MPASPATPSKKKSKSQEEQQFVPWDRLHRLARKHFGIEHLRPGQREVIEAIFHGCDVLGIMPTGAGKSLCYQLPSLVLPKAVVVVSPLIALMQDQQEKAAEADIVVEKVDSTLTKAEQEEAEELIDEGEAQLVYVTPERLENAEFVEHLRDGGVSLFAVDEAHLVSQWGHDFRPAYLGLKEARAKLGNPPVVALTATATGEVIEDILLQLGAKSPVIVNTGTERPNLAFSVRHTVNVNAKQQHLLSLLAEEQGTGIVYTASVRTAEEISEFLTEAGLSAAHYHGRLPAKERSAIQQRFMAGEFKVLVATKAFGMGIDKPDIRYVYHYEFPDSLESYYQEAGRAGRDGEPARAVLFFRLEDKRIQSFFMAGRYPRVEEVRSVLQALAEPGLLKAVAERANVGVRRTQTILHQLAESGYVRQEKREFHRDTAELTDDQYAAMQKKFEDQGAGDRWRLDEMMHYAESATCRKQLLRAYFGEEKGERCGQCDNCRNETEQVVPEPARHEAVTQVMTRVGEVVTTAPETLPQAAPPRLASGSTVKHRSFGEGRVLDVEGDNILVRFKAGTKRVRRSFIKRVS
jgi:ATP-dependent DNA helicase RecQ